MTRDEEGVMTIGHTEVSSFIFAEDFEDHATEVINRVLAQAAEDGGITENEFVFLTRGRDQQLAEEEGMKKPNEYRDAKPWPPYYKGAEEKAAHPMDTQVGGEHYKTKGLQPLEAVYMNYGLAGLEAAVFTKVNKYFRDKSGIEKKLEDCKKAQHVLQIFQEKLEAEIAKEKFEESYNRNR